MNRGEEILLIDKKIFVTEFKDCCVLILQGCKLLYKINWDTYFLKYGLFLKFHEIFYFLQPAAFYCSGLAAVWSVVRISGNCQKPRVRGT